MCDNVKKPQSQAALADQLIELIKLANRNGLYDAADWIVSVRRNHNVR